MDTDKIKEKVKNLENHTVANGATKEEAQTALKLAQRLIDKYGLDKPKERVIETTQEITVPIVKPKVSFFSKLIYCYLAIKISSIVFSTLLIQLFK